MGPRAFILREFLSPFFVFFFSFIHPAVIVVCKGKAVHGRFYACYPIIISLSLHFGGDSPRKNLGAHTGTERATYIFPYACSRYMYGHKHALDMFYAALQGVLLKQKSISVFSKLILL